IGGRRGRVAGAAEVPLIGEIRAGGDDPDHGGGAAADRLHRRRARGGDGGWVADRHRRGGAVGGGRAAAGDPHPVAGGRGRGSGVGGLVRRRGLRRVSAGADIPLVRAAGGVEDGKRDGLSGVDVLTGRGAQNLRVVADGDGGRVAVDRIADAAGDPHPVAG